jgi:hypothetical protein
MYVPISYEIAMQECPEQVEAIIKKLRKGTSKNKNAAPEELKYEYQVGVAMESYSFKEMIKGVIEGTLVKPKEKYYVDIDNLSNYDLIIDTSAARPEEIFKLIKNRLKEHDKVNKVNEIWVSPSILYPTKDLTKIQDENCGNPKIIRCMGKYFIYEGHKIISEGLNNSDKLIQIEVIGEDNTEIENGVTACEFVLINCKKEILRKWEEVHGFNFIQYPNGLIE